MRNLTQTFVIYLSFPERTKFGDQNPCLFEESFHDVFIHSYCRAKNTCANCLHYALAWRRRVLATLETRQLSLLAGGVA